VAKFKMKTKKAAAKRFKITGSGRVMHRPTGLSHLLSKKSSRRKRKLGIETEMSGRRASKLARLMPYGD
jgi:large subunit ribosomal protein L35